MDLRTALRPRKSRQSWSFTSPKPGGFTLIELLVVVAIIALLISILLPSLSDARQTARLVKCQSIVKQFGTSQHMYATDNQEWFVPHRLNNSSLQWYRNTALRAMLGVRPVPPAADWPAELYCPNTPPDRVHPTLNYGHNGTPQSAANAAFGIVVEDLAYDTGCYASNASGSGIAPGLRVMRNKIFNPAGKIQHIDAADWNTHKNGSDYRARWDLFPDYQSGGGALGFPGGGAPSASVSYRHKEGANPLMYDGHVEYRGKAEVFHIRDNGSPDATRNNNLWDHYRR